MSSSSIADLVSLVGLLVALSLYAMLLWMVLEDRRRPGRAGVPIAADGLALSAALLGLVWNVGAFGLLLSGKQGPASVLVQLLTGIAYAALGFLPAVFVDAAVRPRGERRAAVLGDPWQAVGAWMPWIGYGLSAIAGAAHVYRALSANATPSVAGLRILAVGFCVLIPALLFVAPRAERVSRGLVSSLALLAFAVCAFHLSAHAAGGDTLTTAVFGHHASLPLVLAILYEDYRFAFVDLFLKRAAALVLLAGVVLSLYLGILEPMLWPAGSEPIHTPVVGTLLGLWVATALLFPLVRRAVDRFVDVMVLRRPDYARVRSEVQDRVQRLETADAILDDVCARLRPALNAGRVEWAEVAGAVATVAFSRPADPAARILPTTDAPYFCVRVMELPAGRRLLSDDLSLFESILQLAARRIDSLRLLHERYQRDLREQEILRLATEAELRALQAQLNPHFLFNALNTLGYLMRAAPERALTTLFDLTHLLRAVLKRATGDFVTLGQEMELVESYLAIEKARFEDRLRVSIDVPESLRRCGVPPLILQPLVENAIKHGIALRADGGELRIVAWIDEVHERSLVLQVLDSGPGADAHALAAGRRNGVGLANVEKRLAAYYGQRGSLHLSCRPGGGMQATLRLAAELLPPLPGSSGQGHAGERSAGGTPA
jgi:two-component system LytT family sensor kinase